MSNSFKTTLLGQGLIGTAWAEHLYEAGVLNHTWNWRDKSDCLKFCSDIADAVSDSDIVHVVVSDEVAALNTVKKALPHIKKGSLVIQSTTIDPATSTKIKNLIESSSIFYLEAPFTGSLPAAKEKKTVFYLGGEEKVVLKALEYLKKISSEQFVIGTNEQASALKLSMNLLIAAQMQALCEAFSTCRSKGVLDEVFFAALKVNAANSGVALLKEPKLRNQDYSPQFSIKHMTKDMRLLGLIIGNDPLNQKVIYQAVMQQLNKASNLSEECCGSDISALYQLQNNKNR